MVDEREKAFIEMATRPISIGDPDKMDSFSIAPDIQQPTQVKSKKETTIEPTPAVEVDPITGRKIYKGPKLRSRKIVDGKVWDSSHPDFYDKGVGGI